MTMAIDHNTDGLVQSAMRWHFDAATGSPFWVERAASLPFDPIEDVTSWADLALFPDLSSEWKHTPAESLIPRGCRADDQPFQVFESGGSTGQPKRIVESTSRRENVEWVSEILGRHGVPGVDGGGWLHIGPTGPHIVGRTIGMLAQLRRSLCFYIDFDPRWVKRSVSGGNLTDVGLYVDHVITQSIDVLRSQRITVIFLTPPVLEAICRNPVAYELVAENAKAIIWAGTHMSAETLNLVEEEMFPGVKVVGLYGNTLMGIAPQRPRLADDDQNCVFQSFYPRCQIRLVELDDADRTVEYGRRGQVKFTLVSRNLFVPNCLERDTGIRVSPVNGFGWDGIADIQPLHVGDSGTVIGVY